MGGDSSEADWLRQIKTGTASEAQQDIWDRYFGRLVALARNKLRDAPAAWHDEEDVALSAMNSFLCRARAGKFPQLANRDDLWKLLMTITARKVWKVQRRAFAQKRGSGKVRGESIFVRPGEDKEAKIINKTFAEEPGRSMSIKMRRQCH